MFATGTLIAALASGAALSAYVASEKTRTDDLDGALLSRYLQVLEEEPDAADQAAVALSCRDGMCTVVKDINSMRSGRPCAMASQALARTESRAYADRDEATSAYLRDKCDCALRSSLADALRGASLEEAVAAMAAADHILDVDGSAADLSLVADPDAPPVTVKLLAKAVRKSRRRAAKLGVM